MFDKGRSKNNNDVEFQDIELQELTNFKSDEDDLGSLSSNSALSSILENLNQFSELEQQNASSGNQYEGEEDDEESSNLLADRLRYIKKSYAARKKCLIIFGIVFVLWLVALISYSQSGKVYKGHKHDSVQHSHDNSTTTTPSPTKSGGKISDTTKRKIKLSDFRMGNFYVFNVHLNFVGDKNYIVRSAKNYLFKNFENGDSPQLFDSLNFNYGDNSYHVNDIQMSPAKDKVLIKTDPEQQWRHSSWANYWVYDAKLKIIEPLYQENVKLNNAQWSTTGKYVSFVYEHDVFVKDLSNNEIIQVTEDGSLDIFNGKPDWVYEEEVLSTDNSIWWSTDDSNMMFMKLDDTAVPVQNLEFFVQDRDEKYPEIEKLKYPKPGYNNPKPTLINYNLQDKKTTELPKTKEFGDEFILYYLKFVSGNEIIIKESDRESNIMHVNLYNTKTGSQQTTRVIEAKDYGGWIEKPSPFVLAGDGYIDTVVFENYNHLLYFQNLNDSTPFKMLTSGNFDITDQYSYNLALDEVYLISTVAEDPLSHHLFKISLKDFQLQNLTDISKKLYYDINFNEAATHAVLNYEGPDLPYQKLVKLQDFNTSYYNSMPMLNNNGIAKMSQTKFDIPTTTYGNITMDGITYQYIELKPLNFDPLKKYPLLVNIYGGPGSIKLSNQYQVGFEHVVSSSLDLCVIYLDPRGTGGKGWEFKKYATEKIGYWEPRDITDITKVLMLRKPYINREKTAIWGWSYGGFTTLKTLEYDAGSVFKYGMAVAPVTNWLFYDSIYTERFMNKPENNKSGYDESKVNNIANFKKLKRFLIMHGTADDNVHLQNTLNLLDEFDLENVENYDMHIFPDSNHSIYYNNANTIVYDKLFNWLKNAFEGKY